MHGRGFPGAALAGIALRGPSEKRPTRNYSKCTSGNRTDRRCRSLTLEAFIIASLPKRTVVLAVFAIAFLALSWNIWNVGIASGYIDSVKRLGAQDESVYTREAIHMATRGDWMTMTYLDRFVLFKPPLLMWLSGFSAKVLGIHPFALRLPSLIFGSLACVFAFLISKRAGWAAVVLLVSDRLFHTLSRVNMTDMILCACVVSAFYFFLGDPTLRSRKSFWGFTISCACAILDKSIAGVLPYAVTLLFLVAAAEESRWRLVLSGVVAVVLVLPWHLYQFFTHYEWFLAEYLGVQLLAFGGKPPQTSQENQFLFYGSRLLLSDPILTITALAAIPMWFRKRSEPLAILLFTWVLVFGGALIIFQYRSLQYLLPLIPALAIASSAYCPKIEKRTSLAVLCAVFLAVKAALPDQLWGNSFVGGSTLALAKPLNEYCEQQRPNDLFIIDSGRRVLLLRCCAGSQSYLRSVSTKTSDGQVSAHPRAAPRCDRADPRAHRSGEVCHRACADRASSACAGAQRGARRGATRSAARASHRPGSRPRRASGSDAASKTRTADVSEMRSVSESRG